ncbi:MAG: peptide chain release factor 3, partial [bacterium]|nr:peptide chain release factor 3 [bacterium]
VNKLDMPSNDAFDLLSEIEDVLGIDSSPMNWPVGYGRDFVGIADVKDDSLTLFEKSAVSGAERAKSRKVTIEQASTENLLSESVREQLEYELSLLKEAGNPFSRERFLAGELTPVFFGSALTNFGVEPFFDAFVDLAPSPGTRRATSDKGEDILINPAEEEFSAFVFKIQANMDLRHRDSMAFLRVCSGQFERDISIQHHRLDKQIRLSRSHSMFGGERETLDAAYPGDIVGVVNPGTFMIGDTISVRGGFSFPPMPQFPPEVVASLRPTDVSKRKQFDKGIKQLSSEGAIQLLRSWDHPEADPYIAAVGKLQFEVLQHRLESEYNVKTVLEIHPYQCGAWLEGNVKTFKKPLSAMLARDSLDRPIVLFRNEWEKKYAENQHPDHKFLDFASEYRLDQQ